MNLHHISLVITKQVYALDQEQSGMSTMIVRDSKNFHISASVQFGIPYTYFMASVTRKFDADRTTKGGENGSSNPSKVKLRGAIK